MMFNTLLLASKLFPHASQAELDQHSKTIRDFALKNPTFPDTIHDFMDRINLETPTRKISKVDLWDFQKLILMCLESRNSMNILAARQMGISFLLRAYALWIAESRPGSNIILSFHKFAYGLNYDLSITDYTPSFTMIGKSRQTFANGSTIWSTSHNNLEATAKGKTIDCLLLDCAQYISFADEPKIKHVMAQAKQVVTTGNAGSKRSMFYDMTIVNPSVQTMIFPWYVRPDLDQTWAAQMIAQLGQDQFDHEYNLEFR